MKTVASIALILASSTFTLFAADEPPVHIDADVFKTVGGLAVATGNVQFTYRDMKIQADSAKYDANAKKVIVEGDVRLKRPGCEITTAKAVYFLKTGAVETTGPSRTTLK